LLNLGITTPLSGFCEGVLFLLKLISIFSILFKLSIFGVFISSVFVFNKSGGIIFVTLIRPGVVGVVFETDTP
jgi:hypothetical protein